MINQKEIKTILDLESDIKKLNTQLSSLKGALFERINEGEKVKKGQYKAYIKITPGKKVPKYKELFTQNVKDYEAILESHIENLSPPDKKVLTLERGL